MQLQFLGANRQVTGSCHHLRVGGRSFLIDCGLYQERPYVERNWAPFPVQPKRVDTMLLTHAHLDHCGLIPKLVAEGFRGEILATPATIDLARIVWEDSARIQVEDAAYKARRHKREGRRGPHPETPLYTPEDVQKVQRLMRNVAYDREVDLGEGVRVTYRDAGHILGSAMLEIHAEEGGERRTVVFSGDVGPTDRILMRDPHRFQNADYVVMESTYGDRDQATGTDLLGDLASVVNDTVERGGNLVIPTFAIDRAQELLYLFSELTNEGRIPRITIFLDSPMAISVTTIYKRFKHLLDEDTLAMFEAGRHPFQFPGLHFVRSPDESRSINSIRGSCVILAGSGMCTGGRVKHHLRQNIGRPESTVLFTGYQADHTLGRCIARGDPEVRIHGRTHTVRARVQEIQGLSAHAGRSGLVGWLEGFESPPRRLFLTHGEEMPAESLASHVRDRLGWDVEIPEYTSTVDL